MGADLLLFAEPEFAEVLSGRKNIKTAAKSVGRQTLRKFLGSGSKKRNADLCKWQAGRAIPSKCAKQASWSRRDTFISINS